MRAGLLSTEMNYVRDAEAIETAEGSIQSTDMARGLESCGVEEPKARTYALHRDLGGLHATPLSWWGR